MAVPPDSSNAEPPNQGAFVVGLVSAFTVLSCIAVGLRFWSRHLAKAGYWWDDWVSLAAVVVVVASNCTRYAFVEFGLGQHADRISPMDLTRLFQTMYADMLLYSPAVALIKLSAVLLYARIFPGRQFRWVLWGMGIFIICWLIAFEFAFAFQCTPVPRFWDHRIDGTCLKLSKVLLGQSIPHILSDFVLMALPMKYLYHLQLALYKKISVAIIFILGNFIAIVAIIRVVMILNTDESNALGKTHNVTPNIWTSTELNVGILCVCLPACNVLLRVVMKKLSIHTSSWNSSSGGKGSNKYPISTPKPFSPQSRSDSAWGSPRVGPNGDHLDTYRSPLGKAPDDVEMLIHSVERHDRSMRAG